MNTERLLEVYEKISEAPDAIARLRRFVLDLAVRGKLVEQDPTDEPASELLKEISAEKAAHVKARKIRKPKPFAPVEHAPFRIPEAWAWVRIGELGKTQTGSTPPKSRQDFYGTDVPFIRPGDLYPNHVDYSEQGLSHTGAEASGRLVSAGSLLMVCIGTVGKCQVVDRVVSFNQQINTLSPYSTVVPGYLLSAFRSDYFQEAAWAASARTTIAILNKGNWEKLSIPLPPLAEQHRIVAKVDELMALCDRLEEARKTREETRDKLTASSLARLTAPDTTPEDFPAHANFALEALSALTTRPDQIKTLRQTILNLAVRGKLVEQDPADEPASELLEAAEEIKNSKMLGKEIRDPKMQRKMIFETEVWKAPEGWAISHIADVASLRSGVALRSNEEQAKGSIPYIKVAELTLPENCHGVRTSGRFVDNDRKSDAFERGSIIFPKRGGAIATNRKKVALTDVVGDSNLMAMQPYISEMLPFLSLWFNSFDLWTLNSGTSVPQINNKDIYPLELPVPPLVEQHRIVARVNALMALCDQLEADLTTTDTTRTRLLEALLHEALEPHAVPMPEAAE